jgi:hypothetical protein
MATRNYRQAKRGREESRKKRQQEKLQRRQSRGALPATGDAATLEIAPVSEPETSQ